MAYQSLYRKYRPTTFDDMVGQNHITRTLRNAIAGDQLAHAYLFVGPRGTGKTTTARILAKALLCQTGAPTPDPDGDCQACVDISVSSHPDVIELDAASRTGVENVRDEIISRVHFAPVSGTYKVYIIDEVHMLSTGAFNAMLKTLEEPPAHVVFVMCTTHPQKVPQTIRSRCQQFDFHPISIEDISARLGYIAQSEGIDIDKGALPLIAKYADGGMRDAITALEQLISFAGKAITADDVEGMLGEVDAQSLATLTTSISGRDAIGSLQWIQSQVEVGGDLVEITRSLQQYIRDLYMLSIIGVSGGIIDRAHDEIEVMAQLVSRFAGPEHIARLLTLLDEAMNAMRRSTNPRLVLEMVLIRAARPEHDLSFEALSQRIEALEKGVSSKPAPDPSANLSADDLESTQSQSSSAVVSEKTPENPADFARADISASDGVAQDDTREQSAQGDVSGTDAQEPAGRSHADADHIWRSAVTRLREKHPSRYPLIDDTTAVYAADGTLDINYQPDQAFRMRQAGQKDNLSLLANALRQAAGADVAFRLRAGDETIFGPVAAIDTDTDDVTASVPACLAFVEDAGQESASPPPARQETQPDAAPATNGFDEHLLPDESSQYVQEQSEMEPMEPSPSVSGGTDEPPVTDDELMGALDALGATIIETEMKES